MFYEQEANVYDETRFTSSHGAYSDYAQKSTVLRLLGECKGKYILEIGSGTGRFTRELTKRGAHVVCVDLSRKMHEQSRLVLHFGTADYFVMSGSDLGFATGSFDVCLTVNVMSHVRDTSEVFAEIRRVLKKNGFLIANFPNMSGVYFPIGGFVNLFKRSLQAPVYSKWYTFGHLIRSLKGAGLNPVHIVGRMILPKKFCPTILFNCLRKLDRRISNSSTYFIWGDLFIKSYRL
jgi:ubiquinone/menaquinone biosynthesis C-methylase UbiE